MKIPSKFQPTINVVYPKENFVEFERWFGENYNGCKTDREYLGVYWCGYQVNNNYGQNKEAMNELQIFIDQLPRDKKYFSISQYDDGVGIDFKDLDIFVFDMSKKSSFNIPLLCMEHSFNKEVEKDIFASFIGKRTHPIRDNIFGLDYIDGYYISEQEHSIEDYCSVLSRSIFNICPRGYGKSSFRMYEGMQYNSIPVYLSDEYIIPYNLDFNSFGILLKPNQNIHQVLSEIEPIEIINKQNKIKELYNDYFTYNGCKKQIIKHLEGTYYS